VVLRSFFDGANEADSTKYDVISLASVFGVLDQWRPFEHEWKSVLKAHNAPWLHTTDAVSLKGPFSEREGWNKGKRDAFLSDCASVAENHLVHPITLRDPAGKPGLVPRVITIPLKDYLRAREANPEVPKDVTVLCATQSVAHIVKQGEIIGIDFHHLVFDQNEPFMGHVLDRQTNRKARKHLESTGFGFDKIVSVTSADMRRVPALQLADLFAWCYSHADTLPHHKWQNRILSHRKWVDDRFSYQALIKVIPGVADRVKSWGLPPRRPTR